MTDGKRNVDPERIEEEKSIRMRSQFESLNAEMEIADYGVNNFGQSRRKISRQQSKVRTIKRKSLEVEDTKVAAIQTGQKKRMRGSRAALENEVIKGSLILAGRRSSDTSKKNEDSDSDYVEDEDDGNDCDVEMNNDDAEDVNEDEDEGRYELYADELNIDIDESDDGNDEMKDTSSKRTSRRQAQVSEISESISKKLKMSSQKFNGKKIAKTMYRLKNFKSHKMAQKHGAALGAHARGFNRTAVDKLKAVASAAPVAPQVYSSLGLVYESMLSEETAKSQQKGNGQPEKETRKVIAEVSKRKDVIDEGDVSDINPDHIKERIRLANKAFASYHVAALLCKMDYSLWVRAGDAALALANLHLECLHAPPILDDDFSQKKNGGDAQISKNDENITIPITTPEEYVQYHQAKRKKWLGEAKDDYQTADNLTPPGITVPAKLAHTQMELGNISEALTILTDLKNKSEVEINSKMEGKRQRSEMQRSYSAWLLYADLMLIVGHESRQWNQGIQTNENYMFRRWLRKYSTAFEWQERRLQTLCMALEAAAGTKSCMKILSWTRDRAERIRSSNSNTDQDRTRWQIGNDNYDLDREQLEKKNGDDEKSVLSSPSDNDKIKDHCEGQAEENSEHDRRNKTAYKPHRSLSSLKMLGNTFDREREELLLSNQRELIDLETSITDMSLQNDAKAMKEKELEALKKQHKSSILDLVGKYHEQRKCLEQRKDEVDSRHNQRELPLSASCATICDVATQLIKLCLAMNLYEGGRLAAEAVSVYLQQRASRQEQRLRRELIYQERQKNYGKSVLQLNKENYDDIINDLSDSENEDSGIILSDDDDFDSANGMKIMAMMKKGVLPPNLQLLYGLCLISEGNRDFLAMKMIKSIREIEDAEEVDGKLSAFHVSSNDTSLHLFRQAMVDPIKKMDAFALTSDVINKISKDEEWADRLLPLFQEYMEDLDADNVLDILKENPASLSIYMSMRRNSYLKIMFCNFRLNLAKARKIASNASEEKFYQNAYDRCQSVIEGVLRFQDAIWRTKADGNPIDDSVEMLNILSSAFTTSMYCVHNVSLDSKQRMLPYLLTKIKACVSIMCRIDLSRSGRSFAQPTSMITESWINFPVSSDWQSEESHSLISRCAYNFGVSCNVSSFSGWERDEFTLKLLKKNRKDTFFGVNIEGERVVSCLDQEGEASLSDQWQMIYRLVPTLCNLHFDQAVIDVKRAQWCQDALELRKSTFKDAKIACYGEDSALNLMLTFAHISLLLTEIEKYEIDTYDLLKNSLSVVLPLSQMCLDQSLWDSELGMKGTEDESPDWMLFHEPSTKSSSVSKSKRNSQSGPSQSNIKGNQRRPRELRRKTPISKLIKVPTDVLHSEWNGRENFDESEDDEFIDHHLNKWNDNVSGPAKLAMKKLDYSIQKLRQCSTINALRKTSLQVALALLDVSSKKECRNPFICLSQASIFASQGQKGGNSDEDLKKALPRQEDCSAEEARHVLGRADCLRALHFTNEAMFLCSYVAKVCCLHRDKTELGHPWTPQWRVVGIMTYTISVGIDSVIDSLMEGETRKLALESWEKSVRAEIGRGRSDAIAMQRSFGHAINSPSKMQTRKQNGEKILDIQNSDLNQNESEEEADYDDEEENEMVSGDDVEIETDGNIGNETNKASGFELPLLDVKEVALNNIPDMSTPNNEMEEKPAHEMNVSYDNIPAVQV
uniref:Uncharacterized protein n=1 Tax=Chaetoceros debilis TaxID=122233 RepID=A0A6S8WZ86_9STRA